MGPLPKTWSTRNVYNVGLWVDGIEKFDNEEEVQLATDVKENDPNENVRGSLPLREDFLECLLMNTDMMSNKEILKSIRNCSSPEDILGIRSFFGLIESVSQAVSKCNDVAPFRQIFNPKMEFEWSKEMEEVFVKGNESMKKEVNMYNDNTITMLNED